MIFNFSEIVLVDFIHTKKGGTYLQQQPNIDGAHFSTDAPEPQLIQPF